MIDTPTKLSEKEISELKERVNILEYAISAGVQFSRNELARSGKTVYLGYCPFHKHTHKTPSLAIYPATNSFNCFSCKAGGDVLRFIQLKENLTSFLDVVEYVDGNRDRVRRRAEAVLRAGAEKAKREPEYEHSEAFCSVCQREPESLDDFIDHTAWHRARDEWIMGFWHKRGVETETVEALNLGGYVNGRPWAIMPITTPEGRLIGARKRSVQGSKAYRPWRSGEPSLDEPYAIATDDNPTIFFAVEGEIKLIVLMQYLAKHGISAMGLTGFGAKFWRPNWARHITGELIVIPDPDEVDNAGSMYEDRVLSSVDYYGRSVYLPGKVDDLIIDGYDVLKALALPGRMI